MCQYRIVNFRCGHKYKMPIPPCTLFPNCTREQATLLELNTDMGKVRATIRLHNNDRYSPKYPQLLTHVRDQYPSFFGHGSMNGNNVMASLRDMEEYLAGEMKGVALNVVDNITTDKLCGDECWEGLVLLGREEQERLRRGVRNPSYS